VTLNTLLAFIANVPEPVVWKFPPVTVILPSAVDAPVPKAKS